MKSELFFKDIEKQRSIILPQGDPIIIRLDGKGFSKYTKKFEKPFDKNITNAMLDVTSNLVKNILACVMGYTGSDLISLLLINDSLPFSPWLGNSVQKIVSIASSIATAYFNNTLQNEKLAFFDARVFTVKTELIQSYFKWRQTSNYNNAINMIARSFHSHKTCMNKKVTLLELLILACGRTVDSYPVENLQGSTFIRTKITYTTTLELYIRTHILQHAIKFHIV